MVVLRAVTVMVMVVVVMVIIEFYTDMVCVYL